MRTNWKHNELIVIFILTVTIFLAVFVWGLGLFTDIEEEPYVSEETDRIVVGVSQLGSESGWRTANTESVQSVFTTENGYFLLFSNARQKQENQIKAIRSFISQRVDYIVFAPVVENGWRTVLQEAKEAGIPVIMMDRKVEAADQDLCVSWVGTDSRQEGVKAGRWLEGHLRKEGVTEEEDVNIVVLTGTEGASSAIGRSMGFAEVAHKHANWKILEEKCADFTSAKGKEVMAGFLRKYPDIDVVVSQNDDMTFGAIEAIREAGRTVGVYGEISIISFDAVHDALEMVADGTINVDIECNPNQGEYLSQVISMLEKGQEVEKDYYVEGDIFTIDNVTEEVLQERNY